MAADVGFLLLIAGNLPTTKRSQAQWLGNIAFGAWLAGDGQYCAKEPIEHTALAKIRRLRGEGKG